MRRLLLLLFLAASIASICITSCVHKPQVTINYGGFPDSVGKIFVSKCATAGCHNQASYHNAGELLLDSWEHLFQGGISGAVAIAYSTKYSPLLYYINAYDADDFSVNDPGHIKTPLTLKEYTTVKNWIAAGAPDNLGNVPFASNPDTRQKLYLNNQGCDLVAVIDGQSRLVMRYMPVGMDAGHIEDPHFVTVSSDGKYGYLPLYSGNYLQKFDTRTDTIVASLDLSSYTANPGALGYGGWSLLSLSPQDTAVLVSGYAQTGYVLCVNTANMTVNKKLSIYNGTGLPTIFPYPHGIASNPTFDTFYAAPQWGNLIIKYHFMTTPPFFDTTQISVDGLPIGIIGDSTTPAPNPHQILMLPDHSRYFVTCQKDNLHPGTVNVFDGHTNALIAQIPVGMSPQEMDFSKSKPYLFVCCMSDNTNPAPHLGTVYVIDYNTLDTVKVLRGDFYGPHDVAVDDQDGLVYIPSRNVSIGTSGVLPHHATFCGGNAGWYTVYDLNTLQPADNKRYEVNTDPYAIATRFK